MKGLSACPFLYIKMMESKRIISVDAMGGDHAPVAVLGGMNQFLYQNGEEEVFFRVFGTRCR